MAIGACGYQWIAIVTFGPMDANDLLDKVDDLLRKIEFENRESIIAGDMNCNLLKEENHTKHIKNAYSTFGYTQLVKHATRTTSESSTLIDHLATTKLMSVSDKGVIPCGISDHDAIFLVRSMRVPRTKKQPKIIEVRKFHKFDSESFLKNLASLNLNEIKNITADPNHMWLLWKKMFLDLLDKHAPITEIKLKGNNLPYIMMEMRRLIRTRDHLKKKANQSGSKYLHQAFQQIRNKVTYGIRKLRSDYYSKKIKESIGDIRSTWKILKEITNNDNKSTSINEINIDGKVVSDGKGISDRFNDHFVSIGNKLAGEILDPVKTSIDYFSKTGKIDTRFSFKRIQPKQVFDILSKLKNGKAIGQNMIPNQILKSSKNIISQSLADIFNASLKSSIFPDDLKIARVAPIFKEFDRDNMTKLSPDFSPMHCRTCL